MHTCPPLKTENVGKLWSLFMLFQDSFARVRGISWFMKAMQQLTSQAMQKMYTVLCEKKCIFKNHTSLCAMSHVSDEDAFCIACVCVDYYRSLYYMCELRSNCVHIACIDNEISLRKQHNPVTLH